MMDLHCHSVFSDGTDTPEKLIALGKTAGLSLLALTDHDCIDALPTFLPAGWRADLSVLSGIEVDVRMDGVDPDTEIHLLGYGFDPGDSALQKLLRSQVVQRDQRNARIVERLAEQGFPVTLPTKKQGTVSRAHIAKALVDAGHAADISDAFSRFLGADGIARDNVEKPHAASIIALLHQAGGRTAIAHPMLIRADLFLLLGALAAVGLDGLEVYYPTHTAADIVALRSLALVHGLFVSVGSDHHGQMRQNNQLGSLSAWAALDPAVRETEAQMLRLAEAAFFDGS